MVIQSQKLVFLIALCFYFSGVIVARIYSHKLYFPKPKSFFSLIRLTVVAVILSSLLLVSFVSRLGEVQFGLSGNPPLEPRGLEVEFFPNEEVLHEKVKIYR